MSWHPATLGPLSLPSFFIGRGDFFYSTDGQGKIRGKNRKNNNNNKGEDGQWRGGSSSSFHLRASAYKQQRQYKQQTNDGRTPLAARLSSLFNKRGQPTSRPVAKVTLRARHLHPSRVQRDVVDSGFRQKYIKRQSSAKVYSAWWIHHIHSVFITMFNSLLMTQNGEPKLVTPIRKWNDRNDAFVVENKKKRKTRRVYFSTSLHRPGEEIIIKKE